jgi:ribosome-interacting GTPase 1
LKFLTIFNKKYILSPLNEKNKINHIMIELINIEKEFNTNKALYYNLHIKIDSMNQLFNEGWKVIRLKSEKNGKKENVEKQVAIVSVLGNKNSGKSFFLSLLTNKKIHNGYMKAGGRRSI